MIKPKINIRIFLLIPSFLMLGILFAAAQNPQLAMHYYNRGEYEKAESIFQELVNKNPANSTYFEKLMDCQIQLQNYDQALTGIDDRIRRFPNDPINLFLKGSLFELTSENEKAEDAYKEAINIAADNPPTIPRLAQEFQEKNKYQWAIDAYRASAKKDGKVHPSFTLPMATLYYQLEQYSDMIDSYLDAIDYRPESASFVLNYFQRYLPDDHLDELKKKVLRRLQSSDNESYNEILAWAYIQDDDFNMAYRQLRAIDKRKQENGYRLFQLGENAIRADKNQEAIRIFEYIIRDKGKHSPYFYKSHENILEARKSEINIRDAESRLEDMVGLTDEYLQLADSLGYNRLTAPMIRDIARIQAFELHDYPAAVETLEKLIAITGLSEQLLSESKILLADIYLSTGERWEATLLYSQVDKAHKEDETGQMARFKNAKLSYYMGDFEWAQKQFDILRAATSRLIANDAIDMNVFIIDNMGLDTTDQHLKAYATADFLYFKNETGEALSRLDSLRNRLSEDHNLQDDIIYLEAKIYENNHDYQAALERYQQIVDLYPDDIWADNALYAIGQLYLEKLHEPDKALKTFEQLFLEFSNSTFAVDARKQYRELKAELAQEDVPKNEEETTEPDTGAIR